MTGFKNLDRVGVVGCVISATTLDHLYIITQQAISMNLRFAVEKESSDTDEDMEIRPSVALLDAPVALER